MISWQEGAIYGIISLLIIALCIDVSTRWRREKRISHWQRQQETDYQTSSIKLSAKLAEIEMMIRGGQYTHFTVNVFSVDIKLRLVYYITVTDKYDRIVLQADSRTDAAADIVMAYTCRLLDIESIGMGLKAFSYNLADRGNK